MSSLAREVHTDYKGKKLHIICVLKGGINTFSDFISQLIKLNSISTHSVPLTYDFVRIKSYENMQSSGKLTIESTLEEEDVKGKDILIIEDIVDTANTIIAFTEKVSTYNPNSMKVLSELVKRLPTPVRFYPDYVGFSIPDEFAVGYGLDYNQIGRDMQDICILNEKGKNKFEKKTNKHNEQYI
jgi:hypoxanthine phosphoribosyltransferase